MKFVVLALLILCASSHQDKKQKTSDKQVEEAISKGVKWLLVKADELLKLDLKDKDMSKQYFKKTHELILYALTHADINEKNETFTKLFQKVIAVKPDKKQTYNLAVEAMLLVSYNKSHFQSRLAEIAQIIVDRQSKSGLWGYGSHDMSEYTKDGSDIKIPPKQDKKGQLKKIEIKRSTFGTDKPDTSNSQYAALGLRACYEAGIEFDNEIIKLAIEGYEKVQQLDGSWHYCYVNKKGYGSMTIGALGALASYKFMLKEDIKKSKSFQKASEWLCNNFAVDRNPGMPSNSTSHLYYFLYGLERAGAFSNMEKFGSHNWYKEGSNYIVKNQLQDGHWSSSKDSKPGKGVKPLDYTVSDTCFAILFLKKATEELITTQ